MVLNPALLTASLGNKQPVESLLESFPEEAPAFWQEIKPEDLREGMEDIWIETYSISKRPDFVDTRFINEIGVITSVVMKNDDPDNIHLDIIHKLSNDPKSQNTANPYAIYFETSGWSVRAKIYQLHKWVQLDKEIIPNMPLEGIKGFTLRIDTNRSQTHNSLIFNNVQTEEDLTTVKSILENTDENTAVYFLSPKPVEIKRAAEAIPPMPGEKPAPQQPQPGGDTPAPADGDAEPDIPPMPGTGAGPDKDKRSDTTELGEGWWSTRQGEK